jgi:hypothetical protein
MQYDYLERYLAGQTTETWRELTELDDAISQEPLYQEAFAVARETMRRARFNVECLVERLATLNYRFTANPWTPPGPELQALVADCEAEHGPLPLSLRLWYEEVGVVDFTGFHPRLSDYAGRGAGGAKPPLSDPLCLWPPDPELITTAEIDAPIGALLDLGPDMCHKGGYSGGGPTAIALPNPTIDGPLISNDWDGLPLVEYLRLAFRWGGFAGLSRQPKAATAAEKELAALTAGLKPI